ncbi:C2H2-type domain-containing protein [Balamuthia mandrillaris]
MGSGTGNCGALALLSVVLLALLFKASLVAAAADCNLYVDDKNGDDKNNGTAPSSAFKTVNAAAELLSSAEFPHAEAVVCLAPGIYNDPQYFNMTWKEHHKKQLPIHLRTYAPSSPCSYDHPAETCAILLSLSINPGEPAHPSALTLDTLWVGDLAVAQTEGDKKPRLTHFQAKHLTAVTASLGAAATEVVEWVDLVLTPRPFRELGIKSVAKQSTLSDMSPAKQVLKKAIVEEHDLVSFISETAIQIEDAFFIKGKTLAAHGPRVDLLNCTFTGNKPNDSAVLFLHPYPEFKNFASKLEGLSFEDNLATPLILYPSGDKLHKHEKTLIKGCYFGKNPSSREEFPPPLANTEYNHTLFHVSNVSHAPNVKPPQCGKGVVSWFGLFRCQLCTPGTFANETGMESCLPCAAGQYAASAGAVQCFDCPVNTVAPEQGAAACDPCPKGQEANGARTLCQKEEDDDDSMKKKTVIIVVAVLLGFVVLMGVAGLIGFYVIRIRKREEYQPL